MKKVMIVALLVVTAASLAMAQGTSVGNQNYTPTVDIFGAHLNGGRGCAGCHAPHSGGRGSGQNNGVAAGVELGDDALWGTDTTAITNAGTITFSGFPVTFSTTPSWGDVQYKHIATCLSCHDGNISKGAMMSGQSWEQSQGMLNFSVNNSASLYGTSPIPTLLGNDGGPAGDYNNDHPVGPAANIYAVAKSAWGTGATNGLTLTLSTSTSSTSVTVSVAAGSAYESFAKNYGYPAVKSLRVNPGETDARNAYVVCTTCHNQHNMVVFKASSSTPIATSTTGKYQTYFFVKGPYNPGASYDTTHAPSTMQFCRECHFSMSNEAYGNNNIGTAF